MFSVMCSELLIMSEISCPLWSSVCGYQSVECAVLCCGDVVSLGGKYTFSTVMSLVLPILYFDQLIDLFVLCVACLTVFVL